MFDTRRPDRPAASHRSVALGQGGMVATSQALASFAAAEALRAGGNAVDAAVTAAALLGVVEPFATGVGGDCFMLVWRAAERKLYGLNGSGRAPAAADVAALVARGLREMPTHGMLPVTVPGAVDAWATALARFGTFTLARALEPAIAYATEGFPVSEVIAQQWAFCTGLLQHLEAVAAFTHAGRAPRAGEVMRLPALARTLARLAAEGADGLYRGELAAAIVAFSARHGGLLQQRDLAEHRSTWVEPIATSYRGHELFEVPPNGQGLAALVALNVLERFEITPVAHAGGAESTNTAAQETGGGPDPRAVAAARHLEIEAVKLAYADRDRYLADPEHVAVPVGELLSKEYARARAALIRTDRALAGAPPGRVGGGRDTVCLATADREGNVVSLINSLYFPFGSGMVVDGTGIALQNRGRGFSLDPAHPNCLAPGKRPAHTIIPAMLFRDGRPLVAFGVMGGNVQAQAHVQVVSALVDHGCNIQEALDRPRFHWLDGRRVALEHTFGGAVAAALAARGHAVEGELAALPHGGFGGGQGIMIDHDAGVYWGGSDERKDGCAIGF